MGIKSKFRADRRQPRHAARDEGAITDVPDPEWAVPVPEAQVEAVRASGPQPALREFQDGAYPAEDVPQFRPPMRRPSGLQPQPVAFLAPRGTHPFDAPVSQEVQERAVGRWHSGSRLTQAYALESEPEFAAASRIDRPYAAPGSRASHLLPALSPGTPVVPPLIGDALAREWQPAGPERQSWKTRQRTGSINYPRADLNATFGDYARVLQQVNEITGTRGIGLWPLLALPAGDERWGALADALREAVEALKESNPELSQANARLLKDVLAAPDCETALRLARDAAQARTAGHAKFTPAAPEQAEDAA